VERPGADEAWWEVENVTTEHIVELNLIDSPVVNESWGPNQIDQDVLPPTEDFRLREVPCPVVYDMRAVGEEGGAAMRYEVAFDCEKVVEWELTELE